MTPGRMVASWPWSMQIGVLLDVCTFARLVSDRVAGMASTLAIQAKAPWIKGASFPEIVALALHILPTF